MKATLVTEQRVSIKPQKVGGVLSYDVDNAYPQRVEQIINGSSTATLTTNLALMFLFGKGFSDAEFGKQVVDRKKLTTNKLLRKAGLDILKFGGCAIHVNFNANYQPVSFNYIPFEYARLTDAESKHPDKVAIYDNWDKSNGRIEEKEIEYFDFFTLEPAKVQAQVDEAGGWHNYKGQIYYYSPNGKSYPLSPVDSVLEDMQTDGLTKTFKYRNIATNFMASYIIEMNAFASDDDRDEFYDTMAEFQGADEAMKFMLLEKQAGEETTFNMEKVDIQDVDGLYQTTEDSVIRTIIRNRLIPPVLLMETAGKLGSSKEIFDATNYYNGIVDHLQQVCSEIFSDLFTQSTILSSGNFEIEKLTARIDNSEVVSLISNPNLTVQQKTDSLVILYNFSEEQAQKLAGTKDINVL